MFFYDVTSPSSTALNVFYQLPARMHSYNGDCHSYLLYNVIKDDLKYKRENAEIARLTKK